MTESTSKLPQTEWTLIARLQHGDEQEARRALNDLCAQYHYPLYCYLRRRGHSHHDAQDILHEFLAKMLRNQAFANANAERGRLRCMLLVSLQRFTASWHRAQSHRDLEISSEDLPSLETAAQRYQAEQFTEQDTPDRVFDRKWTLELLSASLRRLGEDYERRGKGELFQILCPALIHGGSLRGEDPETLAARANLSPGALRVAFSRLLVDYREALRLEILETVSDPEAAKEEYHALRNRVTPD
jgi:DNA-directed RNA polymerase specialized sigma24 family protein